MNVIYLGHKEDTEIYAYFPDEDADQNGNKLSYQHIGQHSACHPKYAAESIVLEFKDYEELHNEILGIYGVEGVTILSGEVLWVCSNCANTKVQQKAWVDVNTNEVGDFDECSDYWCEDCNEHVSVHQELVTADDTIRIEFWWENLYMKTSFVPDEDNEWLQFTNNGITKFAVHYREESNTICVYTVSPLSGLANLSDCVHEQLIVNKEHANK